MVTPEGVKGKWGEGWGMESLGGRWLEPLTKLGGGKSVKRPGRPGPASSEGVSLPRMMELGKA